MFWILCTAALLGAIFITTRCYLTGPEALGRYDFPTSPTHREGKPGGPALRRVMAALSRFTVAGQSAPRRQRLAALRREMDTLGDDVVFTGRIRPLAPPDPPGEWVIANGGRSSRRLLYLHGGAWMMGSPRSHRAITTRLADIIDGAVLALDYRLLPEHSRRDGIEDCRRAYRWLLEHGPEGPQPAQRIYTAGDSAGGNLVLSLLNWVRDSGLRPPDAALALSPVTDCTFSSPSLRANRASDPLLGPQFGKLTQPPRWLQLWIAWAMQRARPGDPAVSPIFAELSGLPPILLQASTAEMLIDDARRYVNKARGCNSPVTLQTWSHMIHVWHIFAADLAEGRDAFEDIARFLAAEGRLADP